MSDRLWEPENFENLKTRKLGNIESFQNIKNDSWDMLNNFCFHVYAQNSLFIGENVNVFFGPHGFLAGNQLYDWSTHG